MVKQEMAGENVNILGISELRWTGMDEFNSDDHYIYYCGQESHRKKWSSHHGQQKSLNALLGCNLKNYRLVSVCFQGKPFNIMIIQVWGKKKNSSLPPTLTPKKLRFNGSMKIYKTF